MHTHRGAHGVAFDGDAARCRGCSWQSKSGHPPDDFGWPSCPISGPESERSADASNTPNYKRRLENASAFSADDCSAEASVSGIDVVGQRREAELGTAGSV